MALGEQLGDGSWQVVCALVFAIMHYIYNVFTFHCFCPFQCRKGEMGPDREGEIGVGKGRWARIEKGR